MSGSSSERESFPLFDYPGLKSVLSSVMNTLTLESDRGAILIGAELVDSHLRDLFLQNAPKHIPKSLRKEVLNYPGPLSSLYSRAAVARFIDLIDNTIYDGITHLRNLRNSAAHSPDSFCLFDHAQELKRICDLGPNVAVGINRMACEVILENFFNRALKIRDPDSDEPLFENPSELLDYMNEHSLSEEIFEQLEGRRPRLELGIGIAIICALIIHRRDRLDSQIEMKQISTEELDIV